MEISETLAIELTDHKICEMLEALERNSGQAYYEIDEVLDKVARMHGKAESLADYKAVLQVLSEYVGGDIQ